MFSDQMTSSLSHYLYVYDESGSEIYPVYGSTYGYAKHFQVYDLTAGEYTVHILKAPEGYAAAQEAYPAPPAPGTVTVALVSDGTRAA